MDGGDGDSCSAGVGDGVKHAGNGDGEGESEGGGVGGNQCSARCDAKVARSSRLEIMIADRHLVRGPEELDQYDRSAAGVKTLEPH